LPFSEFKVIVPIPHKHWYPEKPQTIGEYIRKVRMDKQLFQEDIALLIGVSTDCITNWENGRANPQIQYMPKILEFLGFMPLEIDEYTLSGMIKSYRVKNGLSHKKMGDVLGVDASTIRAWEKGESISQVKTKKLIEKLIGKIGCKTS